MKIGYILVGVLVLSLVVPETEADWFTNAFKTIGNGIKKGFKAVTKAICKPFFKVVCPIGVAAGDAAAAAGSGGTGAAASAAAVVAGTHGCSVAKDKVCKRSVDMTMQDKIMYPFSDNFNEYDLNGDKQIEYEEFAFTVMAEFPMQQPEELREPFAWADVNGDDRLDMDEFAGAPFMFAHYGSNNDEYPIV